MQGASSAELQRADNAPGTTAEGSRSPGAEPVHLPAIVFYFCYFSIYPVGIK